MSVRIPKTAELVARQIRNRIVRGQLEAGDALPPEAALMDQFGISRPTLREAYRILEYEGLIEVRRGARGGARVRVPDHDVVARYAGLLLQYGGTTVGDLFGARAALEAPAARMLASRPSRKEILAALEKAAGQHGADLLNPTRAPAFHRLVVELTENQTLILLTTVVESIAEAAQVSYERRAAPPLRQARSAHRDHEELISLIRKGDASAAEAHWYRHLIDVADRLERLYGGASRAVVDVVE